MRLVGLRVQVAHYYKGYPIIDALQKAGGLTLDADITNLKISRLMPGEKLFIKRPI